MKYIAICIIALFLGGCTLAPTNQVNEQPKNAGWSFAVIGDNEGSNTYYDDMVKNIQADPSITFMLHVGDMMPFGGDEDIAAITSLHSELGFTKPLYAIPGNHDIKKDADRAAFQKAFGAVPRSIDVNNVHLILLDNADRKVGFLESELDWLEKDLANFTARNDANSKIVISYHRPFGYPLAETFGDDETKASRLTNERFKEIIAKYPIATMFTGHIHTHLEFPFVVEKNADGDIIKSIPIVVSGGGGQPPQDAFGSLFSADYHYLKVTVTPLGELSIEKISSR